MTVNDPDQTERVAGALRQYFGDDRVRRLTAPVSASDDHRDPPTEAEHPVPRVRR